MRTLTGTCAGDLSSAGTESHRHLPNARPHARGWCRPSALTIGPVQLSVPEAWQRGIWLTGSPLLARRLFFQPAAIPGHHVDRDDLLGGCGNSRTEGLRSARVMPMFAADAEPSRKERGQRGVRPRHPSRSAARRVGAGSSSGAEPRRFRSPPPARSFSSRGERRPSGHLAVTPRAKPAGNRLEQRSSDWSTA